MFDTNRKQIYTVSVLGQRLCLHLEIEPQLVIWDDQLLTFFFKDGGPKLIQFDYFCTLVIRLDSQVQRQHFFLRFKGIVLHL